MAIVMQEAGFRLIALIGLIALSGCTASPGTHTYVGVVRVTLPPFQDGVHSVRADVLGLAIDRGVRLGWSSATVVETDPHACQITVLIDRHTDLDKLKDLLRELGEKTLCYADFR